MKSSGAICPYASEFLPRGVAQKQFDLERLPDSAGETIRIIHIGDYDACPCRGEHVSATGQIGAFRIVSTDFASDVLRIRFRLEDAIAGNH